MIHTNSGAKGFTLIELLIVIGILGILAAAVVVVINPAELLAQARDSQRLQDLSGVNAALGFYVATAATPAISATAHHSQGVVTADTCGATAAVAGIAAATNRLVDSTGWIAVDFTSLTGGTPLSVLPVDPVNNTTYYYCYDGENTNKTWELNVELESLKYIGMEATDGGDNATTYETGTQEGTVSLDLFA